MLGSKWRSSIRAAPRRLTQAYRESKLMLHSQGRRSVLVALSQGQVWGFEMDEDKTGLSSDAAHERGQAPRARCASLVSARAGSSVWRSGPRRPSPPARAPSSTRLRVPRRRHRPRLEHLDALRRPAHEPSTTPPGPRTARSSAWIQGTAATAYTGVIETKTGAMSSDGAEIRFWSYFDNTTNQAHRRRRRPHASTTPPAPSSSTSRTTGRCPSTPPRPETPTATPRTPTPRSAPTPPAGPSTAWS